MQIQAKAGAVKRLVRHDLAVLGRHCIQQHHHVQRDRARHTRVGGNLERTVRHHRVIQCGHAKGWNAVRAADKTVTASPPLQGITAQPPGQNVGRRISGQDIIAHAAICILNRNAIGNSIAADIAPLSRGIGQRGPPEAPRLLKQRGGAQINHGVGRDAAEINTVAAARIPDCCDGIRGSVTVITAVIGVICTIHHLQGGNIERHQRAGPECIHSGEFRKFPDPVAHNRVILRIKSEIRGIGSINTRQFLRGKAGVKRVAQAKRMAQFMDQQLLTRRADNKRGAKACIAAVAPRHAVHHLRMNIRVSDIRHFCKGDIGDRRILRGRRAKRCFLIFRPGARQVRAPDIGPLINHLSCGNERISYSASPHQERANRRQQNVVFNTGFLKCRHLYSLTPRLFSAGFILIKTSMPVSVADIRKAGCPAPLTRSPDPRFADRRRRSGSIRR